MENNFERFKEIISIIKRNNILEGLTPEKVYNTLIDLGPTFIKIGQILSTRMDLIPIEYCKELSKLRSNVKALEYNEINKILIDEYGNLEDIFSYIDTNSLASASIAQVHKAILKNGDKVVIKVKKPNIEEKMKSDIDIMKKVIDKLHINKVVKIIDLKECLNEIYNVTLEELNFKVEVEHLLKFKKLNKTNKGINCPNVYENLSNKNCIVMEYIEGIYINDIPKLIDNKYKTHNIALLLSENYIKQALDDGFFHADPHPNNIIIKDDDIYFLDLGMIGTLNEKNQKALKYCCLAIINQDYYEISRILVSISTKSGELNKTQLKEDIRDILEEYSNKDLKSISITDFTSKMFKMLKSNNLILDKNITMLIRGICVIEPVIKELDPNISLIGVISNKYENSLNNINIDKEKISKISRKIINETNNLLSIPSEISKISKSLNDGELKLKLELSNSNRHIDKIEKLLHELIIGFIDGCLIISLGFCNNPLGISIIIMFIIILSSWLLFKMLIDHKHNGY